MLSKQKDIEWSYIGKLESKIQHDYSFNANLPDSDLFQKETELASILGKAFTKKITITEIKISNNDNGNGTVIIEVQAIS
jgi:hypothetical protein